MSNPVLIPISNEVLKKQGERIACLTTLCLPDKKKETELAISHSHRIARLTQ
jgi:hypothetical protein